MLINSARGQRGVTLIEIILWCAVSAAGIAGLFVFAKKTSVAAAVESEQRQIEDIVKTVDGLFTTRSDFSGLGSNGAAYLKDRASSTNLRLTTDTDGRPSLATLLGRGRGNVTLSVQSIAAGPVPMQPNNGYRLAYTRLLPDECVKLITAAHTVAHSVSVDSTEDDTSGTVVSERGQMKVGADELAQNCSATDRSSVFLYFLPPRAISAGPTRTPPPAARCKPVREVQYAACPAGQSGSITQQRDGTCTGPSNSMVYTAWFTTDSTCQDTPVSLATVTPPETPRSCATITSTRVQACPPGQTGQITEQSTLDSCAGVSTPWTTVGNSCHPATPLLTCTPSSVREVLNCPAGQGGQIVRERSSSCSSLTSAPTWGPWSTISSTCTAACVATGTCCAPKRETQIAGTPCPEGTYGSTSQEQQRFLGCADSMTQSASWSLWQTIASSGSCAACPTSVETQQQWVARTEACPAGSTGGTISYEAEQIRTRDVSYNCPAGTTTLPAPTYGNWSAWADTGSRRNTVDSCVSGPAMCPDGSSPTWRYLCGGGCDANPTYALWFPLIDAAKSAIPPGAPWPHPSSLDYAATYDNQPPLFGASNYAANNGACSMDNLGESSARVQRYIDPSNRTSYNMRLDSCACAPPAMPPNPVRLTPAPLCTRSYIYANGQDPAARRLISNLTVSLDAGWEVVNWDTDGRCSLNGNTCTVDTVCSSGNSSWTISVTGRNASTGQEFTASSTCECISRGL